MRKLLTVAGVALTAGLLVVAAAAAWAWAELHRPYAAWEGPSVTVELERGLIAGDVIGRLRRAGVVRRPALVRAWLRWRGVGDALRAGEYRFDEPASAVAVVDRLVRGDVLLHPLTIPEGLTLDEIAVRITDAGFGPVEVVRAALDDPLPIRAVDPEAPDLEGYLFPETYHFPKAESAERIARAMVDRFVEAAGPDYEDRAREVGLTMREAVTLASLIESETSVPQERGRISRVFHNRLAIGMRLQCDPTVIYALEREGRRVERLSSRDLEFDSPWNTYRVAGLPPGPICSPGRASLEAAVEPAEGDELYFVAAPGGGHRFSRDIEAHRRAVREWRSYSRSSR